MQTQEEERYLLEAINSLQRELVVISPDFKILAANEYAKQKYGQNMVGRLCHELAIGPCKPKDMCPVFGRACQNADLDMSKTGLDLEDGGICYGLFAGGHMEGVVRLDFDPPRMGRHAMDCSPASTWKGWFVWTLKDGAAGTKADPVQCLFAQSDHEFSGCSHCS
jgi:hypothetical protein